MKTKGTIILSIVSLLERLSYYGVRAILVLYATDKNSLDMDTSEVLAYYGYWSAIIIFAEIPFCLITDKYLGQRKSIYVGGVFLLIGYLLLLIQSKCIILVSLLLFVIGTSFVKPSATILVGRLFDKEDGNRALAYMIFFLGINIGAFIGVLGIGYVGEIYDWKYGFLIAAISTLVYLCIVYFSRSQIIEIETNELRSTQSEINLNKTIVVLPILVLVHIVFWKSYELETTELLLNLSSLDDKFLFGYEILSSSIHSFTAIWTIPLTIIVFVFWSVKGVANVFKAISISLLFLLLAIVVSFIIQNIQINYLLEFSMIPLGLYAMAEVIISPILTSYVTRISDVRYSNTIYSIFILLTYLFGAVYIRLLQNDYQSYILIGLLVLTITGLLLFKNQMRKLASELK